MLCILHICIVFTIRERPTIITSHRHKLTKHKRRKPKFFLSFLLFFYDENPFYDHVIEKNRKNEKTTTIDTKCFHCIETETHFLPVSLHLECL